MVWFLLVFLLYALVVLTEQALVAVSPHELDQLQAEDPVKVGDAIALYEQVRPTLAALLLTRLLLKIILAVCACSWLILSEPIRSTFFYWSEHSGFPLDYIWVASGILLALILGIFFWAVRRLTLRSVQVKRRAVRLLTTLAPLAIFWKTVFSPFIRKTHPEDDLPAEETTVPDTENTVASGEKREMELLKSIVQFGDTTVKQVMQPRSKVVAVDFRADFHDLLSMVRQAEFSRLPVYDDDLDNVTGILYVKDLVAHLEKPAEFEWQPLIRTNVLLAPESKRCSELLQEFKQEKIHMAIVVDEYGGSSGIVTMEDLLEEVIGDIRDEFDEESELRYRKLDEFNYLFEGQTLLNDVCRVTGLPPGTFDEARNNADTLAGLVLELKGDIPQTGTEITWDGFLLTVIAANNRRIEQLKLTLPPV
jgi:CBS domain containing-hemolysin-like protein